jgi:hypothetical protein
MEKPPPRPAIRGDVIIFGFPLRPELRTVGIPTGRISVIRQGAYSLVLIPTVPAGSVPIRLGTVEQSDSDPIPYT